MDVDERLPACLPALVGAAAVGLLWAVALCGCAPLVEDCRGSVFGESDWESL